MNAALNDDDKPHRQDDEQWLIFPRKKSKQPHATDMVFTHLTFDPSTRVILKSAFREHSLLQSVRIPSTVKKICKDAFWACQSLSHVDFQEGLQTIGNNAFYNCSALEGDVKLPDTVVVIGAGAFQRCGALNRVQLPGGLKVLLPSTFLGCISLVEIDMPYGLSRIGDKTFYGCTSLRNVKIPHTVKVIGESAFGRCRRLTFVELPKGLKKICRRTFEYCDNLSGIVLPGCLEEIEYHAFMRCYSLLGVEFAKDCHVMKVDPEAFTCCIGLVNVCIPGTIEFVKRTSVCGCMSFSECSEPFSGNSGLCGEDGHPHVRDRFAELPIHSLCYHASETRADELKQALDACSELESTKHKDYLGMTPFHIVATSVNPRVDIFECLLSKYPVDMLTQKDFHGKTMVDYLLKNTRGVRVLQTVLRVAFAEWLLPYNEELPEEAREANDLAMNLTDQINSLAECVDRRGKRERVREIYHSAGFQSRSELATLLDLASWKRRIVEVQNETHSSLKECRDREICRYQGGAEVVIENVTDYLWGNESKYSTALSVFPFCTLMEEENWLYHMNHGYQFVHGDPGGVLFFD